MISVDFLLTSLIVVLIPGTGVVFAVSVGLVHGKRAGVFAALGCTAGIVPHLLASVFGLAAILHTSAVAFQALKFAGVAYLFHLAYATWRETAAFFPQCCTRIASRAEHVAPRLCRRLRRSGAQSGVVGAMTCASSARPTRAVMPQKHRGKTNEGCCNFARAGRTLQSAEV